MINFIRQLKSENSNTYCYRVHPPQKPHLPSSVRQSGCFHRDTDLFQREQQQQQHPRKWKLCAVTTPFEISAAAAASVQTSILDDSSSSITVVPTFEPILNVPAFTVFVFILSIFVLLQWRIRAIDQAAFQRNVALRQLRNLKALELSDPTLSMGTNSTKVQTALQEYQRAYDNMEELRTILPGIRIVSPPSSNFNSKQQEDHEIAAQQFLGIAPLKEIDDNDVNNNSKTQESPDEKRMKEQRQLLESPFPLSPTTIRNIILIFVAITQIALFLFLIGTDPMMPLSKSNTKIQFDATTTAATTTKKSTILYK